jgi:hypothetical protein
MPVRSGDAGLDAGRAPSRDQTGSQINARETGSGRIKLVVGTAV